MTGLKTRALALLSALVLAASAGGAQGADLGGGCCADLEERIAELEATAARKGNRKMSLTVYGTINKALLYTGGDLDEDLTVTENSNVPSLVGFAGKVDLRPDWAVGYVLEVGVGGYDQSLRDGTGYGPLFDGDTNDIYTYRSYGYLETPAGLINLGLTNQATDGIVEMTTANTTVASRPLSLRPLIGPQIGEVLDIFDGTRTNLVRYDSLDMGGFTASASWANGSFDTDDVWDAALRYAGEFGGLQVKAGVGYRRGLVIPSIAAIGSDDFEVFSGSVSAKHMVSGLFANVAYGRIDAFSMSIDAYHVQGGWEKQIWADRGTTTLYGEFADSSDDLDMRIMGVGVVQQLGGGSVDLYLTGKRIELGDIEADLGMAGMRLRF